MRIRDKVLVTIGALAILAGDGLAEPAGPPSTVRFAIVIGNNAPEPAGGAALQFGDDDALATHRLLREAGVHSALLARFDKTTERINPGAHSDGLPRWPALYATFDRLAGEMRRERASGRAVELLVFYSGHGGVAHGEGYVLLEDRHLTRSALAALLARSPANRNHVIIDACKSYYMAFEKGPGGHRVRFGGGFIEPATAGTGYLASTGFVLSTSSDRDSHEWDRFGGGVFSHTVRSALRGAADVDGDGRITYAELGAFLATSSQAIANPRLRPDFLIRPPAGLTANLAETVLRWDGGITSGILLDQPVGHVYIETVSGERVLDVHVASSEQVNLRVPDERPLFVRGEGTRGREYAIRAAGWLRVSELAERPLSIGRRGAEFLAFEQLFSMPFGHDSVRRFTENWSSTLPPADGSPEDAAGPSQPSSARTYIAIGVGASGLATAGVGFLFGAIAKSNFGDAKALCGPNLTCNVADHDRGEQLIRDARSKATISTVLVTAGGVAIIAGAVVFLTRPSARKQRTAQIVPVADERGAGLAIAGRF